MIEIVNLKKEEYVDSNYKYYILSDIGNWIYYAYDSWGDLINNMEFDEEIIDEGYNSKGVRIFSSDSRLYICRCVIE